MEDLYINTLALVLGLLVGSFLNVVIYRLPISLIANWRKECQEFLTEDDASEDSTGTNNRNEKANTSESNDEPFNIAVPRSHCPACKAPIKAWQNIPVLSYLLLKGKCANCKTSISLRYPALELVTGLLSLFVIHQYGATTEGGLVLLFTWCLISLTMIDIDHQLLPDNITLPLLWLGLLANALGMFTDVYSSLYGAAAGYMILWCVFWAFKLATGKEGMGQGDFKLLAVLGAWMGWQSLPLIIILSSAVGAVIGIAGVLIYGKDKNKPIPFGPYLAIAGWIAFFWGDMITKSYLQFASL